MNQIFNPARFAAYLLTELKRAAGRLGGFWTLFGVAVLLPVLRVFMYNRVYYNHPSYEALTIQAGLQLFLVLIILSIIGIAIPLRCYGMTTERGQGSGFFMLPVSSFEKTLSMILITLVIAPALLSGVYLLTDSILVATFAKGTGQLSITYIFQNLYMTVNNSPKNTVSILKVNVFPTVIASYMCTALTFLISAVIFREKKFTFGILLHLIGVSSVISLLNQLLNPDYVPTLINRIHHEDWVNNPFVCPPDMIGTFVQHSLKDVAAALIISLIMCVALFVIVRNKKL